MHRLRLFDRDHAVLADNLHGLSNDGADLLVAVGRDRANLRHRSLVHRLRQLAQRAVLVPLAVLVARAVDHRNGFLDAALQRRRVCAGRNRLHAFAEDRLRQNRRRRRAVAGNVRGLRCNLAHQLRAHVLQRILQIDLFGHRHAVLGDGGRAKLLLNYNVAALGAKRRLHSVCQRVHAAQNRLPGILTVQNLLCHCYLISWFTNPGLQFTVLSSQFSLALQFVTSQVLRTTNCEL